MKQCTQCKEWKDESEFHKNRAKKDWLNSECKTCAREKYRKYYKANTEIFKEYRRKSYKANHEKARERTRKWEKANPEKNLKRQTIANLRRNHNIHNPPEEFIECKIIIIKTKRLLKQQNLCETSKN